MTHLLAHVSRSWPNLGQSRQTAGKCWSNSGPDSDNVGRIRPAPANMPTIGQLLARICTMCAKFARCSTDWGQQLGSIWPKRRRPHGLRRSHVSQLLAQAAQTRRGQRGSVGWLLGDRRKPLPIAERRTTDDGRRIDDHGRIDDCDADQCLRSVDEFWSLSIVCRLGSSSLGSGRPNLAPKLRYFPNAPPSAVKAPARSKAPTQLAFP